MNICASDQCSEELLKLISLDLSAFQADKLRLIFCIMINILQCNKQCFGAKYNYFAPIILETLCKSQFVAEYII